MSDEDCLSLSETDLCSNSSELSDLSDFDMVVEPETVRCARVALESATALIAAGHLFSMTRSSVVVPLAEHGFKSGFITM